MDVERDLRRHTANIVRATYRSTKPLRPLDEAHTHQALTLLDTATLGACKGKSTIKSACRSQFIFQPNANHYTHRLNSRGQGSVCHSPALIMSADFRAPARRKSLFLGEGGMPDS